MGMRNRTPARDRGATVTAERKLDRAHPSAIGAPMSLATERAPSAGDPKRKPRPASRIPEVGIPQACALVRSERDASPASW